MNGSQQKKGTLLISYTCLPVEKTGFEYHYKITELQNSQVEKFVNIKNEKLLIE